MLVANVATQAVTANSNVVLGTTQATNGTSISYTAPDTVNLQPGTYLVEYTAVVNDTTGTGNIGGTILFNDTALPYASTYYDNETDSDTIKLQAIVTANTASTIKVQNQSTVTLNYINSNLIVVKLA